MDTKKNLSFYLALYQVNNNASIYRQQIFLIMINTPESFISDKKFYAEEHFPYGLSGSGEFSHKQVRLLEKHGQAYTELQLGQRSPINDEERRFIKVCQGIEQAQSAHELTWLKFCEKTHVKTTIRPFSGRPQELANSAPYILANDE